MTLTNESTVCSKNINDDVERLRDWLSKQPHLPHELDSDLLRAFVTGSKTIEIAKQKLDAWFTLRGQVPQLFSEEARNPLSKEFQNGNKAIMIYFLPKMTPDGFLVLWYQCGEDFSYFDHPQKIARTIMMLELAMVMYPEQKGVVFVYDIAGIPGNVFGKFAGSLVAATVQWFQNTMPLKLKKIFIFNSFSIIEIILNTLIKPFLKAKLFNRMTVTNEGVEVVRDYLGNDIIPKDYGGNEKTGHELDADWKKLLEAKADWFKETARLVSDERKRPADSCSTYGVEGTFRSLTID